jgi:Flp pilus assembly protein TadG
MTRPDRTARPGVARRAGLPPRRGRTAVETAIVINLLFMLLLAVFEYGRLIMTKQLMDNAAREGARLAVVSTNSTSGVTTAQIQSTVTSFLAGQTVNNLAIQAYQADATTGNNIGAWNTAPFGSIVAVQVDLDFVPILPVTFNLPGSIHLMSRSLMRSEAN